MLFFCPILPAGSDRLQELHSQEHAPGIFCMPGCAVNHHCCSGESILSDHGYVTESQYPVSFYLRKVFPHGSIESCPLLRLCTIDLRTWYCQNILKKHLYQKQTSDLSGSSFPRRIHWHHDIRPELPLMKMYVSPLAF